MLENPLQQFTYGQPIIADVPSQTLDILGITEQLSTDDALAIHQLVPLDPLPLNGIRISQAVALVEIEMQDERYYILARTHFHDNEQNLRAYHYILLPPQVLSHFNDLTPLLKFFEKNIALYSDTHTLLSPLELPLPATWTMDKGVALLKTVLDNCADGDIRRLLFVLGAVLDKGAIICNFEVDAQARIQFIQALFLLLPAPARPHLTFTSNTVQLNRTVPKLVFSDTETDTDEYWQIDWQNPVFHDALFFHPYVAHLFRIWDDDMIALAETLRSLDVLATFLMKDKELDEGLLTIVERHKLDLAVRQGDNVTAESLINVLESEVPLDSELRLQYVRLLLEINFDSRQTEEAEIIVGYLEAYPELEEQLKAVFDNALENQPDGLYAFVRVYLNQHEEIDKKWLKRLHQAADNSMQIVIATGDPQTMLSWLNLLAREPVRYELGAILKEGILAAQSSAAESDDLGQGLLIFAIRRQSDILPTLLNDTALLSALPDVQAAIHDFDTQAIDALATESRELFLLALVRAIEEEQQVISPIAVRHLWQLHTQQKTNSLPLQFRPLSIIKQLAANHATLLDGALVNLITLILLDGGDELFFELVPPLVESNILAGILVEAFQQSGRSVEAILSLINTLQMNEWLTPQQIVDTYTYLLVDRDWDNEALPFVEQLARILSIHTDADTTTGVLWKLAELAAELKNEMMLRVATRRLLDDIAVMITEAQIIDSIMRLRRAAQWSNNSRANIIKWWREYVREQNIAQLQKLDKTLDNNRNNDDLRSIIQTTIALRRVIGTETLAEFAESISKTYRILQALSEGFDPNEKLIDGATIRGEIDARSEELPDEVRHVLATNLKELAQLVTTLSDNRSKPSLIRSDESVERQLLSGEQQPQSAIDVMRWLSGYLDGVQKDDEVES